MGTRKPEKKVQIIYAVTDLNGNPTDSKGNPYGWYMAHEKQLCENYCRAHNLDYHIKHFERW